MNINLDDETEVQSFISSYGTLRGRVLANRLGVSGKGSARFASDLSNYAWNKHTAISLRRAGNIPEALKYEAICDRIYNGIPSDLRPW